MKRIIILLVFSLITFPGFSRKDSTDTLYGIASFYSFSLDSTITATGEIYTHGKLTGASNNFKLNTWVKVTNLKNGRSVIVRINDRMHPRMAEKGRVIDLSRSAAKILGFMRGGLTRVQLIKIPKAPKTPPKK
jgi:rare lipoprotein A